MPITTIGVVNSADWGGAAFLTGTTDHAFAIGVPSGGHNTILADSSDVTYYAIFGEEADDVSQGALFSSLLRTCPGSAFVSSFTLHFRARGSSCNGEAFTEVWSAIGPSNGIFSGNVSLTSDWAAYSTILAEPTGGWEGLGVLNLGWQDNLIIGLRGRTDCPTGGGPIVVDWSEATLDVDLDLDPIVTTRPATSIGVGAAELQGLINPGQDPTSDGSLSTLFPVTWQFMFGVEPSNLEEIGSPSGYILGNENHAVTARVTGLSALTNYFFRLKAFCGGETFLGAVVQFKTSSLDPSFGAF